MLYKILDPRIEITNQDGIILLHDIFSELLIDRLFKDLIYFDLINDMIILAEEDDEWDKEVDGD